MDTYLGQICSMSVVRALENSAEKGQGFGELWGEGSTEASWWWRQREVRPAGTSSFPWVSLSGRPSADV